MARAFPFGLLAVVLFGVASGCVENDSSQATATEPETSQDAEAGADVGPVSITGSVVDSELMPIPGATVTATPGDYAATTGGQGEYELGPVEPGMYTLTAAKGGYSGKAVQVEVVGDGPLSVILTLDPLPSDEGYFETLVFDGYIQCQVHLNPPNLNAPCSTFGLEYFGGPQTIDTYQFLFEISAPGFQELVLEASWEEGATVVGGGQFWIENPESGANYIEGVGETPMWHKAIAGIANDGNEDVFYPTPGATEPFMMGLIGLGMGDATVPGAYYWIEWRYRIDLSLFYNSVAPAGFTVLPG